MTIQRRYEPDRAALERVAEILYRLLVETTEEESMNGASQGEAVHSSPSGLGVDAGG